jgi:hypothetical protein
VRPGLGLCCMCCWHHAASTPLPGPFAVLWKVRRFLQQPHQLPAHNSAASMRKFQPQHPVHSGSLICAVAVSVLLSPPPSPPLVHPPEPFQPWSASRSQRASDLHRCCLPHSPPKSLHPCSPPEPFEHWFYIHEWAPLIIFFGTYLGIVRNKKIPHVARYHIMMVRAAVDKPHMQTALGWA